jgi:hypothetical protein
MFCGAGGESTGIALAAQEMGYKVNLTAINHVRFNPPDRSFFASFLPFHWRDTVSSSSNEAVEPRP